MKRILGNLREIIGEINSILSVVGDTVVIAKDIATDFAQLVLVIISVYYLII